MLDVGRIDAIQTAGPGVNLQPSLKYSAPAAAAAARVVERIEREIAVEEQHGTPISLVVAGRWNVPPERRPAGWQKMGIPE